MGHYQHYNLKPVIVLGSHTMGLAVIRALGKMGVPIIVILYKPQQDMGYISRYVREVILAPHPEKSEEQFIDGLIQTATHFKGAMVIPTSDETLVAISRNKSLLEQDFLVACTEWNITEQFIDKKRTYALAESIGVPVPKTIVPHSVQDVVNYSQTIEFPCLVKPCESHSYYERFKRKMTRVVNLQQMLSAYQEAADAGLETMLQELIPGDDSLGVNYNSYSVNGQQVAEFTAAKIRNAPPLLGSPCVAMSKHIPEVLEPGRKILHALGFYGYACTEFKKDPRDGVYKLMEVNGRHNLSGLLASYCGINFPWLHYQHLAYSVPPSTCDFKDGIYWVDILRDIGYSLESMKKEHFSLSQYLLPYIKPHVHAIWDLKDPKPFFCRLANLTRKAYYSFILNKGGNNEE